MNWVTDLIIPLVEVTLILGFVSWIGFYVVRGFLRNWQQQWKWFFKFKIMRKSYPEKAMKWSFEAIDKNLGYYEAKKILFVNCGENMDQVYETLYVYDQFVKELHTNKKDRTQTEIIDGNKFDKNHSGIKPTELPLIEEQQKGGG